MKLMTMNHSRVVFLVWVCSCMNFGGGIGRAAVITSVFDTSFTDLGWKDDINYAVDQWNALFKNDPFSTTITFREGNLLEPDTAGLAIYSTTNANGFVATSTITFNTGAAAGFFVDTTPLDNSEFGITNSYFRLNSAAAPNFLLSGVTGIATDVAAKNKWDLISVTEHEIGHCLGIGYNGTDPANYNLYDKAITAGSHDSFSGITVGTQFTSLFSSLALPVTEIPIDGSHINGNVQTNVFDKALMAAPGFQSGQRSLITDIDILAVGSIYNLNSNQIGLAPAAIIPTQVGVDLTPEPSTFALLGAGLFNLGFAGRKRKVFDLR